MPRDAAVALAESKGGAPSEVPGYLNQIYWWAYVHPRAVYLFERQWLVNLILWGNFARLRDAALDALGAAPLGGRTLQIACVYGNLTARLAQRLAPDAELDVVDVLPVQLDNLKRKLGESSRVGLIHGDASALRIDDAAYDRALLFFLLHEQPLDVRRATIAEALRVVKPGGKLIIVDYHQPVAGHPLRWLMRGVLRRLEPFALDLWAHPVTEWFPANRPVQAVTQRTMFGGLYQLLEITV